MSRSRLRAGRGYIVVLGVCYIMCLSVLPSLTTAAPLKKPPGVRFPEQTPIAPELLKDGQTAWDKAFIMKMINVFEGQTSARLGLSKFLNFTRDYVFEGDIILERNQALSLVSASQTSRSRRKRKVDVNALMNASSKQSKRWSLPINYAFHDDMSEKTKASIREGVADWEENTCIRFTNVTKSNSKTLLFINDHMCYSYVGNNQNKRKQIISIGDSCSRKGIVAHEIGHALGFWHEHARNDRDEHVEILWDNIELGQSHNFANQSWGVINNLAVPYDVGSVMHYSGKTFAKGSAATIMSHDALLQNTMGQRQKLSFYDVKIANMAYCNDSCIDTELNGTCQHDGYQDPNNCTRCRCPDGMSGDLCDDVAPSSENCGGTIHLYKHSLVTISSPGYPTSFSKDLQCHWLIKSPNGTSIRLQFLEPYIHSRYCDSDHPFLQCEDFVEVRIADSLALTGGRFCCNDSQQSLKLEQPIISHTNHALVMFRTQADGYVGFSLNVSIDSCGGCFNNHEHVQRRCTREVVHDCTQTWYVVKKESGCIVPFWRCAARYKKVPVYRTSKCYTEEPYCCDGFTLSTDNKTCERQYLSTNMTSTTINTTTSYPNVSTDTVTSTPQHTLSSAQNQTGNSTTTEQTVTLNTKQSLTSTTVQNGSSTTEQNGTSTTEQNGTSTTEQNGTSTTEQNGTSITEQNGTSTTENTLSSNHPSNHTLSSTSITSTTVTSPSVSITSTASTLVSIKASSSIQMTSSTVSPNDMSRNVSDEEDEGTPNTWSQWVQWSACSVSCGGCGTRSRSRTCENGHECKGRSDQTDRCDSLCSSESIVKTCATTTVQRVNCGGWFGWNTCYRTLVSYTTQTYACCCGYHVKDGVCVQTQK